VTSHGCGRVRGGLRQDLSVSGRIADEREYFRRSRQRADTLPQPVNPH
jgi:hypothetical protein